MQQKWKEGCLRLPSSAFIKWLPQLVSHLKRSSDAATKAVLKVVLMKVREDYPQALYIAIRVLKHELPELYSDVARFVCVSTLLLRITV